jgi:DNA mismatch repair protein MSH3
VSRYRGGFDYLLTPPRDINRRLDAVQEIRDYSESRAISALLELLSNLPDLEKGLCRIQYGSVRSFTSLTIRTLIPDQCKPSELCDITEAFHCVANKFPEYHRPSDVGCDASILNSIIFVLPKLRPIMTELMGQLNHGAARAGKKENMWTEASKYCDLVNGRRDVRGFSLPHPIP